MKKSDHKSAVNHILMHQLDWWWVGSDGLTDQNVNPLSRHDPRRQHVLVKGKSLVLILHKRDTCCLSPNTRKEWTEALVIEPDFRTHQITLQMLSDALFRTIPKGSEDGLEPLQVIAEDDNAVVAFAGFDH